MDLELGPDGWVYLAERDRILRVRDSNDNGSGDQVEVLAQLQTEADYPHNGLSGLAWHPDGRLIFALGEKFLEVVDPKRSRSRNDHGNRRGRDFLLHTRGTKIGPHRQRFLEPFWCLCAERRYYFCGRERSRSEASMPTTSRGARW